MFLLFVFQVGHEPIPAQETTTIFLKKVYMHANFIEYGMIFWNIQYIRILQEPNEAQSFLIVSL